ncbi:hypothetical protein [Curtobacterium sp. 1544]|uniref:hypothetical protein n=1 Tax=Curtobacterium sp. 1544 TaxID=3156417 RepID=UPI0033922982
MTDIGPVMLQVLVAARTKEATAHGPARRDAFRITRFLLAGSIAAGYTPSDLAAALGVTAGSIRTRADTDGPIPGTVFATYAGIGLETLTAWQEAGWLPTGEPDPECRTSYPASALITALLTSLLTAPAAPLDQSTTDGPTPAGRHPD